MKTISIIVGILTFLVLGFLMGRKKVEFDHLKAVRFAALWTLLLLFVSTQMACLMGREATEPISFTHDKVFDEWVGWSPMLDAGSMKETVYDKFEKGEITPPQASEALSLIYYIDGLQ